jgi:multimeric flavodoxin WrbA
MRKKTIIIQGSSNSSGDTNKIATYINEKTGIEIIDLKNKNIGQFDYEFKNRDDDFLPLIKDILGKYDILIFATPVYWYTMSGIMKKFFDRISDFLKIDKDTGRKFRGKRMAIISSASSNELKHGFHMPFIESAKYLGMEYVGDIHTWIENGEIPNEVKERIDNFIKQII